MSNLLDEQMLSLKLDAISADGIATDDSGNGVVATVKGTAPLEADEFFGRAMQFDGATGCVDCGVTGLGGALDGGSAGFTVTAWISPQALAAKASDRQVKNVFFARSSAAGGNVEIGVETNGNLSLYVAGDAGVSNVNVGAGELASDDWHFVAVVFGAGKIAAFLDDARYSQSVSSTKLADAAGAPVTVGATLRSGVFFHGGIHGVRVFRSALTDDQVRTIKSADLTDAATASHQSVLIDFTLTDPRGQSTLYIVDDSKGETMTLTIQNRAEMNLSVPAVSAANLNSVTAPLLLRFRPGVLAAACYETLSVRSTDWSGKVETTDDGSALLLLAPKAATEFAPGGNLVLTLDDLSADPAGGARGSRVMLAYRGIGFPSSGESSGNMASTLSGYRQTYLNIVNQSGKRSTPLLLSFVGSNAILNDGASRNSFTLSLINPTASDVLLSTDPEAPTRFVFRLPVSDDPESVDAVCTEGQAAAVSVDDLDGGWKVEESSLGLSHEWTLTDVGVTAIPPQGHIEFHFSGLISSAASGRTSLCLQYQNLPGYWDGHLLAAIEKAPILYRGTRVGIGTIDPANTLHVRSASDQSDGVAIENKGTGNPRIAFWQDGAAKASLTLIKSWGANGRAALSFHDGSSDVLTLRGGNVGIGTSNPQYPLSLGADSTGLALDGASKLKFMIQGVETLSLSSTGAGVSGRFGVGTTSPQADLHLKGTAGSILIEGADRPGLQLKKANTGQTWQLVAGCDSHLFLRNTFGDSTTDYNDAALTVRTDKSVQVAGAFSAASLNVTGAMGAQVFSGDAGYQKLGNLILQWGTATSNTDDAAYYSFPISFPSACFIVISSMKVANNARTIQSDDWNQTQFKIDRHNDISGTVTFIWFAIGC